MEIVLDTNFVTIPFQFRVDVYQEINRIIEEQYELVFPKICLKELQKLKIGKAALELMKKNNVKFVEIPLKKTVDDSILSYAKENNAIVATQDGELKRKVLKNSLQIISLREKQYLIRTGGI